MAKKAIYVGVFLPPAEKEKLLAWAPPTHEEIFAHHLTLAFKPSRELLKTLPIGNEVVILATGIVDLEGCQTASCITHLPVISGNPHITISTEVGTPPKKSGEIISRATKQPTGVLLQGRVGIFTGKNIQYDLEGF